MLNGTCFKTSSSRHITSQRILGELAVKEALMSDFLPNLVPYVTEKRNTRVAELTYVQSNRINVCTIELSANNLVNFFLRSLKKKQDKGLDFIKMLLQHILELLKWK